MSALAAACAAAEVPALALRRIAVRRGEAVAIEDASLEVARGEHVVVLGASGAGKSLLLRAALGAERADAGDVALLGTPLASLRGAARRRLLARVGVLLGSDALFEDRAVADDVALGVRDGRSREAQRRAVHEALLRVGMKHVEHRRPATLGAGQRRRVALARAIAGRPELVVADDPARGLDPVEAGALYALLAQLRARLGFALLVATSDPRALEGADRAACLHRGRVAVCGTPAQVRACADAALQQLLHGRPYGPIAP